MSLLLAMVSCSAFAQVIPPAPTRHFTDNAGIVDAATAQRLDAQLVAFERQTSSQFLVIIEKKLPENTWLGDYTVKAAHAWGVGDKQRDNGVLLFVFSEDRKLRFEIGYGLEGRLPDSVCATIIRDVLRPAFKTGDYAGGLTRGVNAIIRATRGEYQGTGRAANEAKNSWRSWALLIFVIFFLIWLHSGDTVIQRNGQSVLWTAFDVLRLIAASSNHHGGGGGGGGGGDGGFSGGGGDFGGGGASGDW